MRTIYDSHERTNEVRVSLAFLVCLLFLLFPSCQKNELNQDSKLNTDEMSPFASPKKDKTAEGKVRDIDKNWYKTVKIGDQWWMAENLKTTRYDNGELIGTTIPATLHILTESAPKYQWAYDGDEKNVKTYGRLYTWYAVTDSRNVCPTGWHVPTDAEWLTLTYYLVNNGYGYGGSGNDIAKSLASSSGWTIDPTAGNVGNDQATNNSSGFTGLPAGCRYLGETFIQMGEGAWWWSSTEDTDDSRMAWYREINSSLNYVQRVNYYRWYGFSVRCVQDN
jgi:uncharacterized protein (TIGR02145 family)